MQGFEHLLESYKQSQAAASHSSSLISKSTENKKDDLISVVTQFLQIETPSLLTSEDAS